MFLFQMIITEIENPWDGIESIYEFQFFNCPSCSYKNSSKKDFVYHAFKNHPESVQNLRRIYDSCLNDILPPWNLEFGTTSKDHLEPKTQIIKCDLKNNEDKKDFKCYSCIKFFPSKQSFQQHISDFHNLEGEKTNKKGKKCDLCGKHFYGTMERHIETVHNPNKVVSETDFKSEIENEITIENVKIECEEDGFLKDNVELHTSTNTQLEDQGTNHDLLETADPLDSEINSYSEEKEYLQIEYDTFDKKLDSNILEKVSHQKTSPKDNKCNMCNESFSSSKELRSHKQKLHKDKKFNCESCGKSFSTAGNMKIHIIAVHNGQKDHKCDSCGKLFPRVDSLKKHIKIVHEGRKDHKCESCKKSFSQADYLKKHIHTIHEGFKDYKCDSCTKSFSQACHLKTHIKVTHEGRKDYKCEFCGRPFAQAGNLRKHINTIHNKAYKEYICESCGKIFSQASNLKIHMHTIHEGKKDFKCKSCAKSFSQAQALKKHIHTIHDGQKDFSCESCGKSFAHPHTLKNHIYTVHEGHKDHKCEACGKVFSFRVNLKRHIHNIHTGHKDHKSESSVRLFTEEEKLK